MIDDGNRASLVLRQVVCCLRFSESRRANDIQLTFTPVAVVKIIFPVFTRSWTGMNEMKEKDRRLGWSMSDLHKPNLNLKRRHFLLEVIFLLSFENYKCFFQVFEGEPSAWQLKRLSFMKISRETLMRLMEKIFISYFSRHFNIQIDISSKRRSSRSILGFMDLFKINTIRWRPKHVYFAVDS